MCTIPDGKGPAGLLGVFVYLNLCAGAGAYGRELAPVLANDLSENRRRDGNFLGSARSCHVCACTMHRHKLKYYNVRTCTYACTCSVSPKTGWAWSTFRSKEL